MLCNFCMKLFPTQDALKKLFWKAPHGGRHLRRSVSRPLSKQLAKFHSVSRKWNIFRFIPQTKSHINEIGALKRLELTHFYEKKVSVATATITDGALVATSPSLSGACKVTCESNEWYIIRNLKTPLEQLPPRDHSRVIAVKMAKIQHMIRNLVRFMFDVIPRYPKFEKWMIISRI